MNMLTRHIYSGKIDNVARSTADNYESMSEKVGDDQTSNDLVKMWQAKRSPLVPIWAMACESPYTRGAPVRLTPR